MNGLPWLSFIIFLPWAGALLLALWSRLGVTATRWLTLVFSLSPLVIGLKALGSFEPSVTGFQLLERHAWIDALNVSYHLGLDGLSLVLVLLTGLVTPAALLASWRLDSNPRLLGILFLLLQGSALGVFLALDFFLWFIFWELSLVPAFFLIKLWGGPGRTRAAYQFFIYTMGGSAFMLLGFAAIYAATGTLDFPQLARLAADGVLARELVAHGGGWWGAAVFVGVLLGLAVKVPLFPFHTWLPPAYAEAPTGASMFLTGVMSKMGVYGFLRILWPLFPAQLQAATPGLLALALGGVVLGAWAAMRQTDLKRMVAYSSVNHLSYCLLALFAVSHAANRPGLTSEAATAALSGTLLQMFNHGLSASSLFFCVGVLETRAAGRRGLNDFGGVRTVAPVFAGLCGIALFSSLGLPGLNGFVGEFLIFRGVFGLAPGAAAIACLGLLATAIFLLTFYQRVFHGPVAGAAAGFRDLSVLEIVTLAPAVVLMFVLGVWPQLLIGLFNPLVTAWAGHLALP
ncbi:MAG: NADH-quinone oxidoreductase subunit L [Verrucomicrobia bacterium RIFCSPLOWO2_12_FULL_64_8]|nr:MAG: NADH-quinone oxidoreductase subunit L [Verrucomicrobia bacterium RIFCSPLOWO2_12_FULL_64_8]